MYKLFRKLNKKCSHEFMGLILIPLKSVAKLQLPSTVEGLVPIWHQFQYQKSPCWCLCRFYWQTIFSSKNETHWNLSTSQELACFDKTSIRKLFHRWCFSAKTRNYQSHSGIRVQQGTWTPGVPVWGNSHGRPGTTNTFQIESHKLSGYAEYPSLLFL